MAETDVLAAAAPMSASHLPKRSVPEFHNRDTMIHSYLEVTFRKGRALAAYYYLPRRDGDRSVRTDRVASYLVVDFAADGRPIGIEITAPSRLVLGELNQVLSSLGQSPVAREDLAPLAAA
jgi:hypothetical protein